MVLEENLYMTTNQENWYFETGFGRVSGMGVLTPQGCALAAPGRLRQLTFGLGRLKMKGGRPSGRLDFGLCENPKRSEQTYWNGMERNVKNFLMLPRYR